jgi:hypothetical protein
LVNYFGSYKNNKPLVFIRDDNVMTVEIDGEIEEVHVIALGGIIDINIRIGVEVGEIRPSDDRSR